MDPKIQTVCILTSLMFLGLVLDLVRRRALREGYSIVWIVAALILLLLSCLNPVLFGIARFLGVADANSLLFAGSFLFICILLLHVSVELSRLRKATKELAQALAITDWRARKAFENMEKDQSSLKGSDLCGSRD